MAAPGIGSGFPAWQAGGNRPPLFMVNRCAPGFKVPVRIDLGRRTRAEQQATALASAAPGDGRHKLLYRQHRHGQPQPQT